MIPWLVTLLMSLCVFSCRVSRLTSVTTNHALVQSSPDHYLHYGLACDLGSPRACLVQVNRSLKREAHPLKKRAQFFQSIKTLSEVCSWGYEQGCRELLQKLEPKTGLHLKLDPTSQQKINVSLIQGCKKLRNDICLDAITYRCRRDLPYAKASHDKLKLMTAILPIMDASCERGCVLSSRIRLKKAVSRIAHACKLPKKQIFSMLSLSR